MKRSAFGGGHSTRGQRALFSLAWSCGLLLAAIAAAGAGKLDKTTSPTWKIILLDDVGGSYVNGMPNSINVFGEVVGSIDQGAPFENRRAAYWKLTSSGGTVLSTLSLLPGNGTVASGVNRSGQIVGMGLNSAGALTAFYWSSANASPLELPPLAGDDSSSAHAINADGVACGWSKHTSPGSLQQAVAWRITGDVANPVIQGPLELPGPASGSLAVALNDQDAGGTTRIVGRFTDSAVAAAVVWDVQLMADGGLAAAPAARVLEAGAQVYGINNSGVACGDRAGIPVVWSGGSSSILNLARNMYATSAYAINGNGLLVGSGEYHKSFERGRRAVVWPSSRGSMILLNRFLPAGSPFSVLNHASAVDDLGRVVGYGWRGDTGSTAAFVAIPQ